ncbi:MAG: hypothetical protein U5K37_05705 [Natrialbaceae archaeon]|nr:hypothetical protein [Natrialbaceae archaeon]
MIGTILGMVALEWLPDRALRVALGILALAYVVGDQQVIALPGRSTLEDRCFVETPLAMIGVGGVSGFLFGGTNVGVQLHRIPSEL